MTNKMPLGVFPVEITKDNKGKMRKTPAVSGWQTYQSTIEQLSNFKHKGITIPSGVLVFDLDMKGRTIEALQDSIEILLDCELEIEWDEALIQTTIRGGSHYAFKIPMGLEISQQTDVKDSKGVKCVGFDLRVAGKGWICTGEGYDSDDSVHLNAIEGLYSSDLVELPESAINFLSSKTKKLIEYDDDDENDDLMDAVLNKPLDLTLDEVSDYINRLPFMYVEDQDLWVKIGMAISNQTNGSEKGWEIFDTFSKQSPDNYDEKQNQMRWDSFAKKKSNPITFASVIKYVNDSERENKNIEDENLFDTILEDFKQVNDYNDLKEFGQTVAKAGLDSIDLGRIASLIQNRAIELTGAKITLPNARKLLKKIHIVKTTDGEYIEDYVFRTDVGEYFNTVNKTSIGPRSFDVKHNRETPSDSEGDKQTATSFTSDTIHCVDLPMYAPMFDNIFNHEGLECVNTYSPSNLIPDYDSKNVVNMVIGHIKHLLPNPVEQEIVINFLAHNIQHPGVKIQWGVVLQGVQGDGKTLLAEVMQLILGLRNVRLLNAKTLESNFSDWAAGQCMTFIEEIKLDGLEKYKVLNSIKPYITNDVIEVHPKGGKPFVALNTTNYFALTNYQDAIPIDDRDRRYCILFSQWQCPVKLAEFEAANPGYYSNLYKAIREKPGQLLGWLMTHKIPQSFYATKRAPKTAAKERMKQLSKPDGLLLVEDMIVKFECETINEEWVNITQLRKLSTDQFEDTAKDFPKPSTLKHIMEDLGYHNIGRYKNSSRLNQQIYSKNSTKTAVDFKKYLNDIADF